MERIGPHTLHHGDCLDVLRAMPDNSIDSVVTDPPYGLGRPPPIRDLLRAWLADEDHDHLSGTGGFMGRQWDAMVPHPAIWTECCRVLKPGGHLIAFAGQRTADLMGVALRLGGFTIRDLGEWAYWSGFPKSMDVSKAIDRAAGVEREVIGKSGRSGAGRMDGWGLAQGGDYFSTAPATPAAQKWAGWGTALKPALEPWLLARKPLAGTVAGTVLEWGTGAINIDGCRYPYDDPAWPGPSGDDSETERWPANVYYCPKASRAEREAGCGHLPARSGAETVDRAEGSAGLSNPRTGAGRTADTIRCFHPTVKPLALMRWLVRLVTPPGGVVLDPFAGSGTTLCAAALEGFASVGCEREDDYVPIIRARLNHWRTLDPSEERPESADPQVRLF